MHRECVSADPEIICLGQDHDDLVHQLVNLHFISQNLQDAILVESTEWQPYFSEQIGYLHKNVPLFGWDSEMAQKPLHNLGYNMHGLMDKIFDLKKDKVWQMLNLPIV